MADNTVISELWQTSLQWLKACGFNANKKFIESELTAHPDYPALTSLVDMLDAGGFEYNAVSTDLSYKNEFTYPLLAHIRRGADEQGLLLIKDAGEWDTNTALKESWSGVLVMPEKGAVWQHPDNEAAIKKERQLSNTNYAAAAVIALLVMATLAQQPGIYYSIFTILSAAGLIVAWLTFNTELGVQSKLVKQVCNSVNPEGGCDKVLKSNQAKGVWGVTPADASLAWFVVQFGAVVAALWLPGLATFAVTAAQFALLGIAAAAWSLISQKFVVKQWCALCLSIAAVLVLQFGLALLTPGIAAGLAIKEAALYGTAILATLFLVIQPLKRLIKSSIKQGTLQQQLKKWQQDANVFNGLSQQQEAVDISPWANDLQLGNAAAPVQLTIACNPYCGPCAKAHATIDALLHKQAKNIGVTVRFTANTKIKDDKRTNAVRLMLQECNGKSPAEKAAILHNWFTHMNEEKWLQQYNPNRSLDVEDILKQHENWAEAANIQFTPTFFVNGRQMPGQYKIEDLAVLLPQLSASMQEVEEEVPA
jgi:protein-disulfide isomerase